MAIRTGKQITQVAPPALPQPRNEYSSLWQDQFANVLRLYFNQLNNAVNGILSADSGGAALFVPRGSFYSSVTQTATTINTPKAVSFENVYTSTEVLGISINGGTNSEITVSVSGVYEIDAVLQVYSNNSASKHITLWVNKNGSPLPYTAQKLTVDKVGIAQKMYEINIEMLAGDVVTLMWIVDDLGLQLQSTAPDAIQPGIPSATLNVSHISNSLVD